MILQPCRSAKLVFHLRRSGLLLAALLSACGMSLPGSVDKTAAALDAQVSPVPVPLVLGPVTGGIRTGQPFGTSLFPLLPNYIEEEFLIQGVATAHESGDSAPYTTRILVRRPRAAEDFNGTVLVDWNNVTLQFDFDSAWFAMGDTLMRRGFIYLSVSAQNQGVDGSPLGLFFWDVARYGQLRHPGDDYAHDIFSQAAQSVLDGKVLPPDFRDRLQYRIASGASQSGILLRTYINEVHETARVFDAFMPQIASPGDVRTDIGPQLWWLSQAEAASESAPPEDTAHFRYWETAGPPHTNYPANSYIHSIIVYNFVSAGLVNLFNPLADHQYGEQDLRGSCTFNRYPAGHSWSAALVALDQWLRTGVPPPTVPRIERDEAGDLLFDEHGNVLGGLRSPVVDVPLAAYYAGALPPAAALTPCAAGGGVPLVGTSQTFTGSKLAALYPSHEDYLQKFEAAGQRAVDAGWLLPEHFEELLRYARAADVTDTVGSSIPTAPAVPPIPVPGLPLP